MGYNLGLRDVSWQGLFLEWCVLAVHICWGRLPAEWGSYLR